jgi:hypothetical protein
MYLKFFHYIIQMLNADCRYIVLDILNKSYIDKSINVMIIFNYVNRNKITDNAFSWFGAFIF